ncbi:MAG: hypothetical protein FJ399_04095, partial [Verrucomicrobia bacterium]|nr:hypothetical protein [Verrucomicrobiota bacterium]
MSSWEYKVITSGKGGFATPALLEKFLNDLGRDEWEIIQYQTPSDNPLAFTGLARRPTQRDWTLEDAVAAAARAEAEKLRAEFEAKFKAASSPSAASSEEAAPSFLEEKAAPDDGLRNLVDTSRDDDPEAIEEEKADEWDKLTAEGDELPTFFDAIKPHMRRNQRGPGMSVGVDYLARKWDQSEDDLKGALAECGFVLPADEDAPIEYLEYDGDLYWVNMNRRGELWINTKEKPRQVFRTAKGARVEPEPAPAKDEKTADAGATPPEGGEPATEEKPVATEPPEDEAKQAEPRKPGAPLPEGAALLERIRPLMRRNRRGPGGSGSTSFLARALRTSEPELTAAFAGLGLVLPAAPGDKPVLTEFGQELWWLNVDSRGGVWINGREKRPGESAVPAGESVATAPAAAESPPEGTGGPAPAADSVPGAGGEDGSVAQATPASIPGEPGPAAPAPAGGTTDAPSAESAAAPAPAGESAAAATLPAELAASEMAPAVPASPGETPVAAAPDTSSPLTALRLLLKETRTGGFAGKIDRLAREIGKGADELVARLVGAGLKVPEKAREKPVFVEHAGEIFWFNRNSRGELWLNAK